MNIGAFFNPKKTITIDRPVADVHRALRYLYLYSEKYILTADNELMSQCTYEAYELLNLGVYIEFTYQAFGPSQTQLQIEIRRKFGTFDQDQEISAANNHFMRITNLLSTSLTTDPAERLKELGIEEPTGPGRRSLTSIKASENFRKRPVKSVFVILFMALAFIGIVSLLFKACF